MILTCALCVMHWCEYLQRVGDCYKQLVNDRGSNDAVYYFPKAQYTRGYKQPFLTAASVCLTFSLSRYIQNTTQQHASFINNRFWHFPPVSSLVLYKWRLQSPTVPSRKRNHPWEHSEGNRLFDKIVPKKCVCHLGVGCQYVDASPLLRGCFLKQ